MDYNKELQEKLEMVYDELMIALVIATKSNHKSFEDINDALECVEAALVWIKSDLRIPKE